MGALISRLTDIQAHLDALARQHKVPGAALGVVSGDEYIELATGVLNRDTGVEVTPDSLFQIGSNTKLLTGTLVMQLVDDGKVDLDRPVRRYLPHFRVASARDTDAITTRHLLTHTSGIQGDHFDDHGRGDDCIRSYVESLASLRNVHRPGELFTYCNSGYVVLGHLIETITGKPYHEVLRERVLRPLGMRNTTVLAEDVIGRRVAIGHTVGRNGELAVALRPWMPRSSSPAGSLTWSTVRELLRFGRAHIAHGRAPDGTRILSDDAARAMQQPQHKMPAGVTMADSIGLAWMLVDWDGHRVIRHGGSTIGQHSFFELLPDDDFGVCLLTNGATASFLWRDLARYLFGEFAGVEPRPIPKPPPDPPHLDLARYEGQYERLGSLCEVARDRDGLRLTITSTGALTPSDARPEEVHLTPIDEERFHAVLPPTGVESIVAFLLDDRDRRPRYLHLRGRASVRVSAAPTKGTKNKGAKKKSPAKKPPAKKPAAAERGTPKR